MNWLSFVRYSTELQIPLDIPKLKTNTGQEKLSFFGPKIWSRINAFFHTCFKEKYSTSSANISNFK